MQIYLTGHGGEDFLKFNDKEELTSSELAEALGGMYRSRTYANVLLIIDTCQAATLFSQIRVPNVLAIASSVHGPRPSLNARLLQQVLIAVEDNTSRHICCSTAHNDAAARSCWEIAADLTC